jgi:hypothetical protein
MNVRIDNGEGKYSQDSLGEAEFGLERIMGYAISVIGLGLILLTLMSSS